MKKMSSGYAKRGAATTQVEDFEPSIHMIKEQDHTTVVLNLTGFKQEQVVVETLPRPRSLIIKGSRTIEFVKDLSVTEDYDMNNISMKFEGDMLSVKVPRYVKTNQAASTLQPQRVEQGNAGPNNNKVKVEDVPQKLTEDNEEQGSGFTKEEISKDVDENLLQEEKTVMDDQKEKRTVSEKDGKELVNNETQHGSVVSLGSCKACACCPAVKMYMGMQVMTMVLAVLLAFTLGVCVSKLFW